MCIGPAGPAVPWRPAPLRASSRYHDHGGPAVVQPACVTEPGPTRRHECRATPPPDGSFRSTGAPRLPPARTPDHHGRPHRSRHPRWPPLCLSWACGRAVPRPRPARGPGPAQAAGRRRRPLLGAVRRARQEPHVRAGCRRCVPSWEARPRGEAVARLDGGTWSTRADDLTVRTSGRRRPQGNPRQPGCIGAVRPLTSATPRLTHHQDDGRMSVTSVIPASRCRP